jgi:hypothetical protein
MEMQELEIKIDNEGRVHLWVRGVKGEECVVLTKSLEKAIGVVLDRNFTGEFYEKTQSENHITKRNSRQSTF